jgi:hypothetical protein
MKTLTKLSLIIILAVSSFHSASAFTQKQLNEYNNFKTEYLLTKKRLMVLKQNFKVYKTKAQKARAEGNKAAFELYMAKLDDASFQKEVILDDLEYLSLEIESFDEIEDTSLIALN